MAATNRIVDLADGEGARARAPRLNWIAPVWLAGWSAVVLAMALLVSAQRGVPLRYTLPSEAVNYYTLAAVSAVVWFACARMDARRWPWAVRAAAHVAIGVVLVAIWQTVYGLYLRRAMGPAAWRMLTREAGLFQMMNAAVFYAGIVGGTLAIQSARRAREQERRQHDLALLARDAELRALTAQIEPHFLLNTLTSVLALVESSPSDARTMLERLAEMLTATFDNMREPEVSIGRELDLVSAYLAIEQVRFADRLAVSVDVPAPLREVAVPPFVLQPLVENAIKYAVAPCSGPTTIAIRGRHENGSVRIEVADSGPGFTRDTVPAGSHGVSLTERRLRAFAPDARLTVDRPAAGGCIVSLIFRANREPAARA